MAATELDCPNCGAPLKVESSSEATTHCPYCDTVVLLPVELRPASAVDVQVITFSNLAADAQSAPAKTEHKGGSGFLWVALVLIIVGFGVPTLISRYQNARLAEQLVIHETGTARANFFNQMAAVTPTLQPTLTPTPQYAFPVLTFGEAGIGEGMFQNSGYIRVDGKGNVYVADYEGGRIQRFNSAGQYLSQWRVGNSQTYIHGLSASYNGDVFVSYGQVIEQYDGASGELLRQMTHPQGGEFGDLEVTADGNLAAVWYEGRWGLITSIEGHREELVIFNPTGEIIQGYPNFISQQTDALALDVDLAVDGKGTIYALSDGVIFIYSPEGKYLDRINNLGDQPGQFLSANTLAIDGQGSLYIVNVREISVYDANQRFVDVFTSPDYLNSVAIDHDGGIWGASDEQAIRFALR